VSGIALIFLVLGHVTSVPILGQGVDRGTLALGSGGWSSPFWETWDWTMMFLGLLHGANRMTIVIEDMVRRHSARVALKTTLYVVTLILMLLGTLIILTFDPTKGHSTIVGGLVK